MASRSVSNLATFLTPVRRAVGKLEPLLAPLRRAVTYIGSSAFRVIILLGLLLLGIALFVADGIAAAHLGIYGASAVSIGVLGRLIIWWKLQDNE